MAQRMIAPDNDTLTDRPTESPTDRPTEPVTEEEESNLTKAILKLEEIDKNLYRANYLWKSPQRGVFGGMIIGQALVAASKTIEPHLHVHSMHCYFLLKGDSKSPIVYHVENVRDGGSFSSRLVKAMQHGENIFTTMVSYHKHEFDPPVSHQFIMPAVPLPEQLVSYEDLLLQYLSENKVSEYQRDYIHKYLAGEVNLELKPVDPKCFSFFRDAQPKRPQLLFWIKVKGHIDADSNNIHRCVAAYISDTFLLSASLLPIHRDHFVPTMMASLDHSLWFHTHFQVNEWMLYECESPRLVGNRALCLGRIWKRDGTLAVSVAQEGLVRFMSRL